MNNAQLHTAAERRQHILDFLALNPGARMEKIHAWLAAFGDDGSASNTIRTMVEWGELRFDGTPKCREYHALTSTTRSAEESQTARMANVAASNEKKQTTANNQKELLASPGYYLHKPGSQSAMGANADKPIQNQGGQGNVRARVTVNCCAQH